MGDNNKCLQAYNKIVEYVSNKSTAMQIAVTPITAMLAVLGIVEEIILLPIKLAIILIFRG